jgi:hypothetical protein
MGTSIHPWRTLTRGPHYVLVSVHVIPHWMIVVLLQRIERQGERSADIVLQRVVISLVRATDRCKVSSRFRLYVLHLMLVGVSDSAVIRMLLLHRWRLRVVLVDLRGW